MRAHLAILAGSLALLATACGSSASSGGSPSATSPGSPGNGQQASTAPATASATTPAASTGQASSPRAAGPAPCATTDLQVRLGTSSGAAGSVYQAIDFTNIGAAACTLYGYPGVSLATTHPPSQIGAAAARNPSPPPKQVTLAPGAVAHAVAQITFAGNYPASTCRPTPASALLVYPPNLKTSVPLPYRSTGCSSTTITILHVSVVQPGAG
jgi:Protein of unknown function (DUF4232)